MLVLFKNEEESGNFWQLRLLGGCLVWLKLGVNLFRRLSVAVIGPNETIDQEIMPALCVSVGLDKPKY